jgi:predicted dehydrogenase
MPIAPGVPIVIRTPPVQYAPWRRCASVSRRTEVIGVGVVGAGRWGPQHIRIFGELPGARVAMAADLSAERLAAVRAQPGGVATTTDYRELLRADDVDAVVVATPVWNHARLAREALRAGKHVLVEGPLAASGAECEELIRLAAGRGRVLMVGHTFLYHPAVLLLRDLVAGGEIGEVQFAHAQRLNLGLVRRDVNVLWDLAPHDLSILLFVLGVEPTAVAARGYAHVHAGVEDVAYIDVAFSEAQSAAIHVSWLHPYQVRRLTLIGSKRMVVYDDVEPLEQVRLYDRGIDILPRSDRSRSRELQLSYRNGGVSVPPVPAGEPLRLECAHFLDCIRNGTTPCTDGAHGLQVVRALELADASLSRDGMMVPRFELAGRGGRPNREWGFELRALPGMRRRRARTAVQD